MGAGDLGQKTKAKAFKNAQLVQSSFVNLHFQPLLIYFRLTCLACASSNMSHARQLAGTTSLLFLQIFIE